jgi:hypothetical protein
VYKYRKVVATIEKTACPKNTNAQKLQEATRKIRAIYFTLPRHRFRVRLGRGRMSVDML